MLYYAALVRTDILEEHIACIIRVIRIGELGTTLAVTSKQSMLRGVTLMMEEIHSSEMSVFTTAT
jgi:hypothetical protein